MMNLGRGMNSALASLACKDLLLLSGVPSNVAKQGRCYKLFHSSVYPFLTSLKISMERF